MQAKVAGLEAHTERQDYRSAELRHALDGKRSEQLPPDTRQLAFEDLETAVAEAQAARNAVTAVSYTHLDVYKRQEHLPRRCGSG